MQKEIYLIRHGETDFNRAGIVQGSGIDAPLNDTGRIQAQAFYRRYGHLKFDKIYVSNLLRTYQTVEPFLLKQPDIRLEKHAGLNEICWGESEGKKIAATDSDYYEDLIFRWSMGETDLAIRGGESPLDVAIRQEETIELIMSRTDEKRILICMHGRAMRVFLCQLFDLPLKQMDRFHHHNLSLYHIAIDQDGKPAMVKENCIEHLVG